MQNIDQHIIDFIKRCNPDNLNSFIAGCNMLQGILTKENRKYNLTRITDDFEYWNKHIADSISIALFFRSELVKATNLADIGCGGGFPSLVLALAFPHLNITAIDSIRKKTDFVKLAAKELALTNINVINARARELKLDNKFDIVTARAVAEPYKIYKEAKNWLAKNGKFILYQTPADIVSKQLKISSASAKCNITWQTTEPFALPGNEKRTFLYSL